VVVDTSALMAIVLGEPDAERYAAVLSSAPRLLVAAPTWLEAAIVAQARLGPEGHALARFCFGKTEADLDEACRRLVRVARDQLIT